MITVSIIIVNWNTKDFLKDCLDSILESSGGISYETIIVDNASTDGSSRFIKERYPKVKLLENYTNLGFATACNQAAKVASGRYLFLLNPDTILHRDAISGLIDFMKEKSWIGAVGPQLLDGSGKIANSARRFPTMKQVLVRDTVLGKIMPWVKISRLVHILPMDKPSVVDNISGGALLIKGELWRELGGMDARFFMFYEDVDLCRRIREMGYNVYYLPTVKVIHLGGGSRHQERSSAFYYSIKSRFLYFEKYYPRWCVLLFKCIYKPLFLIELGLDLIFKLPTGAQYRIKRDFVKRYLLEFLSL